MKMTKELDARARAYAKKMCEQCGDEEQIWTDSYNTYVEIAAEQQKFDNTTAKAAFEKAVGWCKTYPWYQGVFEEFCKAMED